MNSTSDSRLATFGSDRRFAVVGVLGFVVAITAASQISMPIPGTPVPFTLQPMIVVLAGLMLGPRLGTASMLLYLAIGAAGVPVFVPGGLPGVARFFGPTGGYLLAYPAAAFIAGLLAQRFPSLTGRWMAACAGIVVVFAGGVTQLSVLNGSVARGVALGITPLALLDIAKAFVAALIARPRVRRSAE